VIKLRSFTAGLFGALACIASAHAADPAGTWAPPPAYVAPRYTELMSGWYLRLDGGYGWNKVKSVDSIAPVVRADYASAPDVTVGFGYKFQWIRFDLTFDRGFPSRFDGFTGLSVAQPQYKAKIGWMTALGNAYIDLGTWWGFTPYVGGGIGATRLDSKKYTDSSLIFSAHGSPESQSTNFSWAAMAGVSFQLAPNWAIDVGVRHLELGKISNTTGSGTPLDYATFKYISTDEVRLGVRFLFD
jgi:opacity protein-like surface antigen